MVVVLGGGWMVMDQKNGWLTRGLCQDTEIWTVGKLPFCQENLEKAHTHMP